MAEKKDAKKVTKATAAKAPAPVKAAAAKPAKKATAAKRTTAKRAVARPVTRVAPRPAAEAERPREERPAPAAAVAKPKAEPRPLPTAPSGEAPVVGADGAMTGTVALPAALVAAKRRAGVLFQALAAAASNARLGTAATRNRARVRGGGAKPWRQKGTGRARQGSTRSPQWRHGGVVFGPNGRRYKHRLPEKMRREAFAEAFAALAGEGRVLVFEALSFDGERPRTRTVVDWLEKIGDTGKAVLVTPEVDMDVARAAGNAPHVVVRSVGALRTSDVLTNDTLLVRRDALEALAARAAAEGRS